MESCKPKKRKKREFFFEMMFQNRKKAVEERKVKTKIRKFRNISQLKRVYIVSSVSGKNNYDATVYNFPTCTCKDFRKKGQQVF